MQACLSDFTPHLLVTESKKGVTKTGFMRCRQLTATLPPIGGNTLSPILSQRHALQKWRNASRIHVNQLFIKHFYIPLSNLPICQYWCPVNLYGRPQKRRVLGKRIEGVASDGMPWKKNPPPWKKVPPPWKKVPTATCFYGPPHRRK